MADIIDVNIGDSTLEVFWQDEVELNLDLNLMYIKSGQKEIQDYVENVSKPEIDNYIETEAKPIVTEVVTQIAEPTINEYIENTTKPAIDEYFNEKKPEIENLVNQAGEYANNAQTSAEASATSAIAAETALTTLTTTATDNYNANAEAKTNAFNTNATNKTNTFNTNASQKQAQVDASATNAKTSETNAKTSETNAASSATSAENSKNLAKQYADSLNTENIVHRTGDEEISGTKTLTTHLIRKLTTVETDTVPAQNQYFNFITILDKNGVQVGYFGNANYTNGIIVSRMGTSRRKQNGSYIHSAIEIGTNADGVVYTNAPTPTLNTNDGSIVNTSWFNKKIQVVSTLPSRPDVNVFYFVTSA